MIPKSTMNGALMLWCLVQIGVNCSIYFQCDTKQCLSKVAEYQCEVNGSLLMTWKVKDEFGIQLKGTNTYTNTSLGAPGTVAGTFAVKQLTKSPILSNISFTVHSNLNGYTILCEDLDKNNRNCTINIAGSPSSPLNLTVSYYSNTSVVLSWSPPSVSSQCVTSYTVNSTTNCTSFFATGLDPRLTIDIEDFPGEYSVSVAAVDHDNRAGPHSAVKMFLFDVAPKVKIVAVTVTRQTELSNINIKWETVDYKVTDSEVVVPPILYYQLTHNGTKIGEFTTLYSSNTSYIISGVPQEKCYIIVISGVNIIGEGPATNVSACLSGVPADSSSFKTINTFPSSVGFTPSLFTLSSNRTYLFTISSTSMPNNGLSSSISTVISIAIIVPVLLAVLLSFLITLLVCLYNTRCPRSHDITVQRCETSLNSITAEIETKSNAAYAPVYYANASHPSGHKMAMSIDMMGNAAYAQVSNEHTSHVGGRETTVLAELKGNIAYNQVSLIQHILMDEEQH